MQEQSDTQLLRAYAEHGHEAAFHEIVSRHADVVYASALRQAGSPDLARDIAQSVFTDLARKARSLASTLTGDASLLGWLFRSTRFAALNQLRDDRRRHARERLAMQQLDPASETAPEWERVQPVLDEAMAELSDEDREALLLRFFKDRDFRTVGAALGISDDAAQKRVSRALERLHTGLTNRGVTTTAGALSALLVAETVSFAPAGLAATLSTAALAGTTLATAATATATKAIVMTTLQKTLIAAALTAAVGTVIYEARQTSMLRKQVQTLEQQRTPLPESSNDAAVAALRERIGRLSAQNAELTGALARANADKTRLEMEWEQAKRAAALYKELIDQANSRDTNPTNAYPTARHVWAAFGRMGRLAALSKEDDSNLSPEEKSALEAAKTTALEDLPNLVKAAKQYDAASPADPQSGELVDKVACLLYGALNLDEQQFSQVYGVMQKIGQETKLKGLSKETLAPEAAEAIKQIMEQWKAETQTLLTPEQARIFAEVVTHMQVEPGNLGFNFNF
jgi:RNA polymerase sigma factor (sigma-70 family)